MLVFLLLGDSGLLLMNWDKVGVINGHHPISSQSPSTTAQNPHHLHLKTARKTNLLGHGKQPVVRLGHSALISETMDSLIFGLKIINQEPIRHASPRGRVGELFQ